MTRKNTNKHYSLRKLKKGTASVAVALSVLGAGLASHHTVQASEDITGMMPILSGVGKANAIDTNIPVETLAAKLTNPTAIKKALEVGRQYKQYYKEYEEELGRKLEENKNLEKELADKKLSLEAAIDAASKDYNRANALEKELAELTKEQEINRNLLGNAKLELDKLSAENAELTKEQEINRNLLGNAKLELDKLSSEKEELAKDNAKLQEDKQILEASRKRTNRDLETARNAKKATEAELAKTNAKVEKLEEEKQILEASRKRTNRDLEAARNAKKEVEAELAKLKAEAEALKEQLAKQAQEIEKLKDSKEASPKAPEAPKAPEKPEVAPKDSGKSTMPWTALTPAKPIAKANMSSTDAKKDSHQLPSTGEAANPFFTAAAMSVMASAGVLALKRKEEN